MKKILVSTIGDDLKIIESLKLVANHFRFDAYCYILTEASNVQENYRNIKEFLIGTQLLKNKEDLKSISLKDIEDFEKIYEQLLESKIEENLKKLKKEGWDVYLDYTYGTKAISGQVLFYFLSKRLADFVIYVSGTRGKDKKVRGNYNPKTFNLSRFYLEQDMKKVIDFIKSFRFDVALQIVNQYNLEGGIKSFFNFYINLLSGRFEEIVKTKVDNKILDFFKLDIEKIFEVKDKLKKYLKAKEKRLVEEVLKFEMGYFYDLINIYFQRKEYPQTLALFCSFLDKYLTYKLFQKKQLKNEDFEFDSRQINIVFKDKKSPITGKKTPVSLSLKLDEYMRLKEDEEEKNFDFVKAKEIIEKRNNSIFGHGFYFANEKDAKLAVDLVDQFFSQLDIEKQGNLFFYYPVDIDLSSITF